LVVVPLFVPFTETVAPSIGAPFSSTTLPFTSIGGLTNSEGRSEGPAEAFEIQNTLLSEGLPVRRRGNGKKNRAHLVSDLVGNGRKQLLRQYC
jgi:hypothetical protein